MKFIVGCLVVGFVAGCAAFDTGPKLAETTIVETAGVTKVLLAQYQPDTLTAGAEAHVNDPRYNVKTFAGTGVYVDFTMSLTGADIGFDIASAGKGVPIDQAVRDKLAAVYADKALSEEARKDAIVKVITEWLASKAKPATSQPVQ